MVDVIISSSHGYRQGALSKWILGGMDPIATAISDFPKRGLVVGFFQEIRGTSSPIILAKHHAVLYMESSLPYP